MILVLCTTAVVVAVHVDAVLEIPYYTIQLSDKSRKKTSWDNLMTLSEYTKVKSISTSSLHIDEHDGENEDGHDSSRRDGRRSGSLGRLSSRLRGSSRRRREQDREREQSNSRHRQRSLPRGDRGDNNSLSSRRSQSPYNRHRRTSSSQQSPYSQHRHRSSSNGSGRFQSPVRSFKSHASRKTSCKRDEYDNDSQRKNHGRPRSQSPFLRFLDDGKAEGGDDSDHRRPRSHSSKRLQKSSSSHPMDSLTSIMAVAAVPDDNSSRRGGIIVLGAAEDIKQRRRSSNGTPPYIKSCYLVKDDEYTYCEEGNGTGLDKNHSHISASSAGCEQELNASCGTLVVVEDVNEDSDDDELFSVEK